MFNFKAITMKFEGIVITIRWTCTGGTMGRETLNLFIWELGKQCAEHDWGVCRSMPDVLAKLRKRIKSKLDTFMIIMAT